MTKLELLQNIETSNETNTSTNDYEKELLDMLNQSEDDELENYEDNETFEKFTHKEKRKEKPIQLKHHKQKTQESLQQVFR